MSKALCSALSGEWLSSLLLCVLPGFCLGRQGPMHLCSSPFQAVSQGSNNSQILDLSNRFYTLIPHDFGMKKPPLLNNTDSVQVVRVLREFGAGAGLGQTPWECPSSSWPLCWSEVSAWPDGHRSMEQD